MKINNIIFQKYRFIIVLMLFVLLTGAIDAQVKEGEKALVNVSLKVVDDNGNAISKAKVVVGEGVIHAETDENGSYSFKAYPEDVVTVSYPAYEKNVSQVTDLIKNNIIKLMKSKLYMTSDDDVELPFGTMKKRNITGSTYVLKGSSLETYPSNDLRNAFTGLVPGVLVTEIDGSPGLNAQEYSGMFGATEKINISSRGQRMMFIIDNIPTDITLMPLDPNEIESVSVIKDIVGKAMFGTRAADGIIFIKTKRGSKNEHLLNVNIEDGVSSIDRMPGWVSGSDYAILNNQARTNDGLIPNYTDNDISDYAQNDPYDKYHPNINFRDMMLKNNKSFTRVNLSSSGGNDIVQYFSYLGYNGEGDIYKIGSAADYNRITTRSNLDIKINDVLTAHFDIYGNLSFRRSPNYGFSSNFTSEDATLNPVLNLIELPSVLNDINTIPSIAFPIYANYDSIAKVPWYGVSQAFGSNPIGGLVSQGYYVDKNRTGVANLTLEYDMGNILKGLKSKTYVGFNILNFIRVGKNKDYIAYIATPGISPKTSNDTINLSKSHLGYSPDDNAKLMDYYYQRYAVYENLAYNRSFGNSDIQTSVTFYLSKTLKNDVQEPERQENVIWTGMYSFKNKYNIEGVLNYAGTDRFSKENRHSLFPSIGASWIISDENFMSNLKFLNYLKLRAEAGILGDEVFLAPNYYNDSWGVNATGAAFGPISTGTWFGTTTDASVQRALPQRIGNPNLNFEQTREFSAGIDALLLNRTVSLEVTYYNNLREGQIIQPVNNLPFILGLSSAWPWYNYNNTRYFGVETGIQFTGKSGDLRYSLGGNATIQNSERLKYDEPNFRFDYLTRVGKPADAYFGQTCLGKFESDADALIVPQKFDDVLHEGDLKYKDMNGDGIIDDNDQSMIGHTLPRLFYALNLKLQYKNFDLTIVGTGQAFYDVPLTNQYYWNGWGDNTYSDFVKNYIGGAYPRLTYYKVNNNFVNSDFWLAKGGFFKIQNVEIAYTLPNTILQIIGNHVIRIYLRGANLLTISKIKDVDPESLSSGISNYPLYKTISAGIKLNF